MSGASLGVAIYPESAVIRPQLTFENSTHQDPFANPNHHHLLGPPLSHHMPSSDHQLKRPLPVNGHNGQLKMPDSPLGNNIINNNNNNSMMHPGMSSSSSLSGSSSSSHPSSMNSHNNDSNNHHHHQHHLQQQPQPPPPPSSSAHIIEEYLQTQINRWRSNNLEMTELISELLTVMPSEDQMQFMTGIMELIYKKRNNPEEEKQMRKYFLGGATTGP